MRVGIDSNVVSMQPPHIEKHTLSNPYSYDYVITAPKSA